MRLYKRGGIQRNSKDAPLVSGRLYRVLGLFRTCLLLFDDYQNTTSGRPHVADCLEGVHTHSDRVGRFKREGARGVGVAADEYAVVSALSGSNSDDRDRLLRLKAGSPDHNRVASGCRGDSQTGIDRDFRYGRPDDLDGSAGLAAIGAAGQEATLTDGLSLATIRAADLVEGRTEGACSVGGHLSAGSATQDDI